MKHQPTPKTKVDERYPLTPEAENKKFKAQLDASYHGRMEDIRKLWDAYQDGKELVSIETSCPFFADVEDLGNINEYGLCFDYVPKGTFTDQKRGYFRYQISYGGPSEELRFFCDETQTPYKIEFWYLDWFKGDKKTLQGANLKLMLEVFDWFKEGGAVEKAMKDAE